MVSKVVVVGLLLSVVVALCGASMFSVPETKEVLLHRSKRFSFSGVVVCLAGMGMQGFNEVANNIRDHCGQDDGGFIYRLCVFKEVLGLGPMYIKCVLQS